MKDFKMLRGIYEQIRTKLDVQSFSAKNKMPLISTKALWVERSLKIPNSFSLAIHHYSQKYFTDQLSICRQSIMEFNLINHVCQHSSSTVQISLRSSFAPKIMMDNLFLYNFLLLKQKQI